ncbi:MAG: glycosyltransferase family 2 protein [Candidatus Aenigmarchaeota archaeon]|nr:glycosyltransferase family 2 protein [Candidatus Aenigmarchaeota archaeon]
MLSEIVLSFFTASSLLSLLYAIVAKRQKAPKMPEKLPKVSVMTYAYMDDWAGNVIKRKIENFLKLDYPKNKMEIIVYDNGSTGKTLRICKQYEKMGLIKHYRSDKGYNRKGQVLDDAIRDVAKGDIIALTDPDGICERSWLRKHVGTLMSNKKIGASIGMIFCGNWYKNLMTRMRAIEDNWMINISYLGREKLGVEQYLCGANYAFKRSVWKNIGGHGKSLVEDEEMAENLKKRGWKIAVTGASVWQEEVESIKHFFIQRMRWYSLPIRFVFSKKKFASSLVSLNPVAIQTVSLISLIALLVSASQLVRMLSAATLLVSFLTLVISLVKMKEKHLIAFIPVYLFLDTFLTLVCLFFARGVSLLGKEVRWERLSNRKYYHNGTRIKVNRNY